jgi:hypothetical protein
MFVGIGLSVENLMKTILHTFSLIAFSFVE